MDRVARPLHHLRFLLLLCQLPITIKTTKRKRQEEEASHADLLEKRLMHFLGNVFRLHCPYRVQAVHSVTIQQNRGRDEIGVFVDYLKNSVLIHE